MSEKDIKQVAKEITEKLDIPVSVKTNGKDSAIVAPNQEAAKKIEESCGVKTMIQMNE